MPRATPLAQVESSPARSPQHGTRPTLVVIRGDDRTPLRRKPAHGPRYARRTDGIRSDALHRFAVAAERRKSSMQHLSVVAIRMAGQAEHLAQTLRTLRFAGSMA